MKRLESKRVGSYVVNVFEFDKGQSFTPIHKGTVTLDAFRNQFSNFAAYCVSGEFSRESLAITAPTAQSLYVTKVGLGESLAKPDAQGDMTKVAAFNRVRYKALQPASYVCVSQAMPFINVAIPRTEIEVTALKPHTIKPNSVVLFLNPANVLLDGVRPPLPYAMTGKVTSLVTTKIVEVVYG
jgi:hypothetical protein